MGKTITQSETFDATPAELYRMFLDSKKHGAMTGGKASVSAKAGGRFKVWDGYATGKNLLLEKDRLIVQSWRTADWKKSDPDSVLVLCFTRTGKGTRLDMTHANVPDGDAADLSAGWREYYWKPMRAFLRASR